MTNAMKGEAALALADGRSLTLVLDFEAMVAAEGAYGKPIGALMADAAAGFVGAVRAMLYGTLRARHPDLTLSDATGIFLANGEAVSAAIERAALASFPEAGEDRDASGPSPAGTPSGGNGVAPA